MTFKEFKHKFQQNFPVANNLFLTDVDRDLLWETYLAAFPEDLRQGYTCNCCRSFIKNYGNVVAIENGKLKTIWDFSAEGEFTNVTIKMRELVTSAPIKDFFVTTEQRLGTDKSKALGDSMENKVITWDHMFFLLPKTYVNKTGLSNESVMGDKRSKAQVFRRSLEEISLDSIETVIELIDQNSIYRGAEHRAALVEFLKFKKQYDAISDTNEKTNFIWANSADNFVAKIKNSAVGTLLMDITEGRELDSAISAFERIMAPANYKRPNAIITKKMIESAEKVIDELGLKDSLGRRFAVKDDISVEEVLFVDRTKPESGIFASLKEDAPVNPKSFSKVEEVPVKDFIEKILPKVTSVELFLENRHDCNFVSLIAPLIPNAESLFKWSNPFSWSYRNAIADSMKQRVKDAGGSVDGVLRFTIQWNDEQTIGSLDFDLIGVEPNTNRICFSNNKKGTGPRSSMSGELDVDMIRPSKIGIENIIWNDLSKMRDGNYTFIIKNYDSGRNTGFKAQVEFDGQIHNFYHANQVSGELVVAVVTLKNGQFTLSSKLPSSASENLVSKKVWGINTSNFHKVNMITKSPNFWGDNQQGNEHLFFMIDKVQNDEVVRGFFNEFLNNDLLTHKRVFEALGAKMKVEPSENQLSGLGFSSTQKDDVIVKVNGSFSRIIKIKF